MSKIEKSDTIEISSVTYDYLMRIFCLLSICLLVNICIAKAGIIRDSEIEEAVDLIVAPLREASGLKDLEVHIINNPIPNAFTAGGNKIFINTGLIINHPDPDILRGIIAHEIGHILGRHVVRNQEIIENYQKASIGATALGLVAAMSGSADAGMAVVLGGSHFARRSIYAYSRTFESSADQTAIRLLEKSSHSVIGLIKFFEQVRKLQATGIDNPYESTHPLSNDRVTILKSFNKRSKFQLSQNHDDIVHKYQRSSAKLAAFTLEIDNIFKHSYVTQTKDITTYMNAIKSFRMGSFDDSLNYINQLIIKHPDDPYYHELKGQLYFEAGKGDALVEYKIAIETRPDDELILLGKAIVGITKHIDRPGYLEQFHKDLERVLQKNPDSVLALHYNAIYYNKMGMVGEGYLSAALIALKSGRIADARKMASAAKNALAKKSVDWYRAGDILAATE